MKIVIDCDDAALALKKTIVSHLESRGVEVTDLDYLGSHPGAFYPEIGYNLALKIQDCPKVRDVLDVTTWEDGTKGAHMQRVYELRDQAGALRCAIRSDWILVDPETRRILRPESFTARAFTVCPVAIDCPPTRKVALPREGLEELGVRPVRWSDLDGNGHLYSGNYGDIVWDHLPPDLRDRSPSAFYINYSREATLDQELRLLGIRDGADAYLMEGVGPGGTCFTCRCEF